MSGNVNTFTPGQLFKNGCRWVIQSNTDMAMALEALKSPSVGPSSVHITAEAAEKHDKDLFCDFLYVIVRRKCDLHVTTDHFKQPFLSTSEEDQNFITRILEQCNDKASKCTLQEFRGRLSSENLELLPPAIVSLGLPIATRQDVALAKMIMEASSRMMSLTELHFSLSNTLQAEEVSELTQYCLTRVCLHFSKMGDTDVAWLVEMVKALDKPFKSTYVGVDEIFLPDSKLTVKGMWELHRQFKRSDLKYPIFVDADGIHEVAKLDLKKDFEKHGNQITFHTSRQPFERWLFGLRKLMTMQHGPLMSRITGAVHITTVTIFGAIVGTAYSVANIIFNRAPAPGHLAMQA